MSFLGGKLNSIFQNNVMEIVDMASAICALRGPTLCTKYNPGSPDDGEFLSYHSDALIFLEGNKIIEFGPSNLLKEKLSKDISVQYHDECRIIKTVVHA